MRVLGRSVVVAFVGTLLWAACGSDSSGGGDDPVALCKQACNKLVGCYDGGLPVNCDTQCTQTDGGGGGTTCTNQAEITAAYKACLDKSCGELVACFEKIPACQGGTTTTGTGGAGGSTGGAGGTGGAGTGGTAGSGGTSGGGTCADLLACCNRASDTLKQQCMMIYEAALPNGDMTCGAALGALKASYCP